LVERRAGAERVVLVYLHLRLSSKSPDLQEFLELSLTAGAKVVATLVTTRDVPDAKYCIGSGKVEELQKIVAENQAVLVLFDYSLTPAQERNLECVLKCRVLDRTGLILDIFAQRAHTYEGKLQVEIAQLKYLASRLVRGWTHLTSQKGGIGLRGPGETQLEVDRRLIKRRIKDIQLKLEKIRSQRHQGRRSRKKALLPTVSLVGYTNVGKSTLFNALTGSHVLVENQLFATFSLVGYTNVGKSTLFNALTGSHVLVENQLFATLDPILRAIELPPLGKVICADTVGFIRQLPHGLVEAFRATLEETIDADLLLHVIDSQDDLLEEHIQQVEAVLEEIGALAVPRIEVYNKIDLAPAGSARLERDEQGIVRRVLLSAVTGEGLDLLKEAIIERLSGSMITGQIYLSPAQYRERAVLFEMGAVMQESVAQDGCWVLQVRLPSHKWQRLWQQLSVQAPEIETTGSKQTDK
jgi:GTP-binding protein HflX